jgi:hypothetical protein
LLVKPSLSSASSVSSEASSDDLPNRKLHAIGSSSEEKESTLSSEEEKSSSQDASSSPSSSSAPRRDVRSLSSVRDLSSSDWEWNSHSSTSQCRGHGLHKQLSDRILEWVLGRIRIQKK